MLIDKRVLIRMDTRIELSNDPANASWERANDKVYRENKPPAVWESTPGKTTKGSPKPNKNDLPVHQAVSNEAAVEVIDALVRANPDDLMKRERKTSRLPLHIACKNDPINPPLIKMLIEFAPNATLQADKLGRVPLHYALENRCSKETVKDLLRASHKVAKAQDHEGKTPLHIACSFGHPIDVIGMLLELDPDGCVMCRDDGKTAAACVLESDVPNKEEVIILLSRYKREFDMKLRVAAQPSSRRMIV
jgi:ankyrin repeat protein